MFISLFSFPTIAISDKEKEDLYRIDNLNDDSLEWLLNSDNFIYHKQAQIKDQDFWYCVLNIADIKPSEIAKAFANDDFSSLWSLNGKYRENLKAVILELANSNIVSNSNENLKKEKIEYMYKYVLAAKKYASNVSKYSGLCDNLVESKLYYICENYIDGGQLEIEGQIAAIFDNDNQLCKEMFGNFVSSNDYATFLQTGFEYIDFSTELLEIAKYSYDVFSELELYCHYDQQYINFLKHLYQTADSYDIISASGQLLTKFTGTYETNYKNAVDSIYIKVCESAGEYTIDELLDIITELLGMGAILEGANWGVAAGKLVSEHFFNTSEMIEIIVTIRAYDELSELLISYIQKKQATYNNYFGSYEGKAEIANELLYYVKLLHRIRKNGENAFYRFRSVLYNANITNLAYTFGFPANEVEELNNWYIATMNEFDAVYDSLFYDVECSLYSGLYGYPVEEQEDEIETFEIVDNKLIKYNGNALNTYIPVDVTTICTNAFYDSHVTTVNFEGEYIETGAFSYCNNLSMLFLTKSIQHIDDSAFVNCPQLTIYGYIGTYAEKYAKENNIPFEALNSKYSNPDFVIEDEVLVEYLGDSIDVFIPYGVTRIGEHAFHHSFYRSIHIPETVVSVDGDAFECSGSIGSLTLYDTIQDTSGFYYINNIENLYIGEGSTNLTSPMFPVTSIKNLHLPDSMENIDCLIVICAYAIEENVFVDEDNKLYSDEDGILYDKNQTTLLFCPKNKDEVKNIPSTVTNIGNDSFFQCHCSSIILPESIKQISNNAFWGASITNLIYDCDISLDSIEDNIYYPDDEDALPFDRCQIETLSIGTSVKTIPNFMFYNAYITSVDLGSHIEVIGSNAFGYCDFENLSIPESVTFIGYEAFGVIENLSYNAINSETVSYPFQNVKNAKIGDTVTVIPDNLFYHTEIKEIEIPDSVIKICDDAFDYSLLSELIIPENVEDIGSGIIYGCENLKKITYNAKNASGSYSFQSDYVTELIIGENVESIDSYIFDGMEQLQKVTILNKGIDIPYSWAVDCPNLTIYSYTSNTSLVNKCAELGIPFVALCEHANMNSCTILESTCTETGIMQYVCSDCGYTFEETLPIQHDFSDDWIIDVEASCTVVGSKSHHCLNCDEKTEITEIPITHKYTSTTVNSTCTTDGSISYTCSICEDVYLEVIPASHTWLTEWTIDIEPTETTDGSKSHHCLYCDEKTDITVIPKLDAESPTTDFKYTIKNGEITIDKYIGTTEVMSIPSHIDGYPVTTIKSFAFSNNATIQKAIIPYTVKDLNYYAFYNCTELQEVKIGNGITTISENCFSNCSKLQKVSLPENLITIKDGAFYYCESLTEITLPNTVEAIEKMAFYKCTALTNINIPDVTYEIGEKAFYGTPWLENLTGDCVILGSGILMRFANEFGEDVIIPEGVQTIYGGAFEETYVDVVYIPSTMKNWIMSSTFTVSAFVVDAGNPYLCVCEGILYNAEKTHLLSAPSKLTGTIVLPSTVVCIEDNAFYSSNLSEIVLNEGLLEIGENAFYFAKAKVNIPNTVVTIGDSAFLYCYGITDVVIPQSVTSIGSWAFNECPNLKSIRFLSMDCDIYDYSSTIPSTAIIYGCPTSTAYFYAEEYDREFVSIHNIVNGVCSVCNCSGQIVFVEDDKHIEGITAETNTITQLQSLININGRYIEIYSCDGTELLDDNLVGTGSVVEIYDTATNKLITSYTIVLYGDVSGDGLIEDADYSIIALITCNTTTLENQWMLMACDVNIDGSVDGFDAIELDLYLNGYVKEISSNQTVEETVTNNTQTEALVIKNKDEEELL